MLSIFTPLTRNAIFSNRKTNLCQGITQWCCVFLQTQLQQITVQEHIFGDFALAHLTFGSCTSPTENFPFTYHPSNRCAMCAVDYFQQLRFGNSQSPDKFTGKPYIKMNVYIYIAHHLQGQWHSLISTQKAKTPFSDSYSCHMTCLNHIRHSCLMTNQYPNTLQRHLSPFHSRTCP